jgi:hypothetical protein
MATNRPAPKLNVKIEDLVSGAGFSRIFTMAMTFAGV